MIFGRVIFGIAAKMATQNDLDKGLKIDSDSIVDVEWLDACAHMNVEKLNPKNLLEWLCVTHTIGKVVAQDKNALCVATNFSDANGIDMIAIPIRWVKSMKIIENG